MSPLEVGAPAPDFELRDQHGQAVTLSAYRGRARALLVFYPYAFSRVCTHELGDLREAWDRFDRTDLAVLAISCDPMFTLRAYAEAEGFPFSLLSDFWPHGAAASAYGAFDEMRGSARRSSYLVDESGTIRWTRHSPSAEGRDPAEYAAAIEGLGPPATAG